VPQRLIEVELSLKGLSEQPCREKTPLKAEVPRVQGKAGAHGHVLADLGMNHVERQVLLCGYSVDRVDQDYGYDLTDDIHERIRGGGAPHA